jgi:uncharacterized protein (DUF488 family)
VPNFYSIGHSNLSLEAFVALLEEAKIPLLVDIRSFPRSRSNPVFNIESLPSDLSRIGIDYRHMRALGGRRTKQSNVEERVNAMWRVRAFHNYADYALGEDFANAFAELVHLGQDRRVAIMCSEAVWWRCHRRIVVDYLLANHLPVNHIIPPNQVVPAALTPGASITAAGKVVYPAAA